MSKTSVHESRFRGLNNLIGEVRACKTKTDETARVRKELANIRKNFTGGKSLSAYNLQKYVWKLVYIHLLGYDVDFGHTEVINLVSAATYAEKVVGYLAASVLLTNTDEQITLVVQSIRNDLQSPKDEMQCLALSAIANIGGSELAESLAPDVQRLMMSRATFPTVRKRSALCMLRLYRVNAECLPVGEWAERIVSLLRDGRNLGVLLSVTTLVLGVIDKDPSLFEAAVPHAVRILTQLVVDKSCPPEYVYHTVPCPWLQVAILRLLAYFPLPADAGVRGSLNEVITVILSRTEVTKSVNKNNGEHSVLFEAVTIVLKQGAEGVPEHRQLALKHLSRFINIREPNIRYLGLEAMARMTALPGTTAVVRKQQAAIMVSLKDADISLRRRALDLLFAMCDESNAQAIVRELLAYLVTAEFSIKDEMVLKTAILAERYAPDMRWYVDTVLQLIVGSGDHISDDVWHRMVQIVTNTEDLQVYAARKVYNAVKPSNAHETVVKIAAYLLGEFGYLLNEAVGAAEDDAVQVSGAAQFAALQQHMDKVSSSAKAILLSTFIKMQNLYPELLPAVTAINAKYASDADAELQQRAVEYNAMPVIGEEAMSTVLDSMPPFPERESVLEARLKKSRTVAKDRDRWAKDTKDEGGDDASLADSSDDEGGRGPSPAAGAGGGLRKPSTEPEPDLLGLDVPAPAPAPASAAAPAPAAAVPPAAPVTTRVGIDAAMAGTLRKQFQDLMCADKGILFEDATVRVGIMSQFSGATGRLMVYFRNKASVPLTAFKVRVPPQPQVRAVVGDVPPSIAVGEQAKVPITVEAMQPFMEAPPLQVSFLSVPGTGHAYPLRLPVVLSQFVEGVTLDAVDFDRRWGALKGEPKEQTFSVPAPGGGDPVAVATALLAEKLGLSLVASTNGVRAAGSFRTMSTSQSGERISVGCLVHMVHSGVAVDVLSFDAGPAATFMVSVRTQHGDVSQALKRVITAQLTP